MAKTWYAIWRSATLMLVMFSRRSTWTGKTLARCTRIWKKHSAAETFDGISKSSWSTKTANQLNDLLRRLHHLPLRQKLMNSSKNKNSFLNKNFFLFDFKCIRLFFRSFFSFFRWVDYIFLNFYMNLFQNKDGSYLILSYFSYKMNDDFLNN